MSTTGPRVQAALATVTGSRQRRSPRVERALLVAAAVAFAALSAWAVQGLPAGLDPTWWLLAPTAAVAALSTTVNGGEVWLAARIGGAHVARGDAIATSALSTAANFLPVPGAVAVKVRALRQAGLGTGEALRSTTALGVVWVGVGLTVAGVAAAGARPGAAAAATVAGVAVGGAGLAALRPATSRDRVTALGIEAASVACAVARVALLLAALGEPVRVVDAAALAAAGITASAAGLFPAGLGLRELLSGLTAAAVGLDPEIGVVVAALDRVVTTVVVGSASAVLALRRGSGS